MSDVKHHLACIVSVTGGLEGPCDCGADSIERYKHRGDVFKEKLIEAEHQCDALAAENVKLRRALQGIIYFCEPCTLSHDAALERAYALLERRT